MHDLRVFREHVDALRNGMRRRNKLGQYGASIDEGVALDARRRSIIQAVEEKKAARNTISQEVARRKRAGDDAPGLIASGRTLGSEIAALEEDLTAAEARLNELLLDIPNIV